MKKILSIVLAIAMIFALSTTAFAATTKTDEDLGAGATSTNAVDVIIDASSTSNIEDVYSVDVAWDALDFTYSFSDDATNEWDPETHTYGDANYTDANWDKTTANIVVTNHSNEPVDVVATMDNAVKYGVTTTLTNASFELATGEGRTPAEADNNTIVVDIKGVPTVEENFTIGTITVTISAK